MILCYQYNMLLRYLKEHGMRFVCLVQKKIFYGIFFVAKSFEEEFAVYV